MLMKANKMVKPNSLLSSEEVHETEKTSVTSVLCTQLRELQRQRVVNLKSRIMIENRLVASIATARGYNAGMEDKERLARFEAARKMIKAVMEGEGNDETDNALAPLIRSTAVAIDGFDAMVGVLEREMVKIAKRLPVAAWVLRTEQKGFGLLSLAIVIAEAGDLNNYANPGKLWRMMASAPFEANGEIKMPSTWRYEGGLSAEEWTECGYNPRRRSIGYVIGENIVKQNFLNKRDKRTATEGLIASNGELVSETEKGSAGPYRARYLYAKERAAKTHDDWKPLRCHRHGMLLAYKLLLKNVWCEWTGNDPDYQWRVDA